MLSLTLFVSGVAAKVTTAVDPIVFYMCMGKACKISREHLRGRSLELLAQCVHQEHLLLAGYVLVKKPRQKVFVGTQRRGQLPDRVLDFEVALDVQRNLGRDTINAVQFPLERAHELGLAIYFASVWRKRLVASCLGPAQHYGVSGGVHRHHSDRARP